MNKIAMKTPLVELDGDEMTRIIWQGIKDVLLTPYIDLKTEYYDLGLPYRDQTDDQVTVDAAKAIQKYGVGVKCATITANEERVEEYKLKKMWKSPNATLRTILDGTIFRVPIMVDCIKPMVEQWKKPITIARHAYGDIYKPIEAKIPAGSKAELVITDGQGNETRELIQNYKTPGIVLGMHNMDDSIASFARCCMKYALDERQPLWFGAKDTISKVYDRRFRDIFQQVYDEEFAQAFEKAGISYFYTLIDDAVQRVMKSEGGFVWACKNYDGDVMSDMLAVVYGSLAMMTSVLVSPDGKYEYEASHGTVTAHYYRHLKGEQTSTNAMATLFAWTGALKKRGELDGLPELTAFGNKLEKAAIDTIESGIMTGDLLSLCNLTEKKRVTTLGFLEAIRDRLEQ